MRVSSYALMRHALDASGRPIVFSICEWGKTKPWLWGEEVGNLWRTTGDIQDRWAGQTQVVIGDCCGGILHILDMQEGLQSMPDPAIGTIRTCWKSATA